MKIKNKGFSLVELLAAIVIMGLLSTVAIISVNYFLQKAERDYYKTQEDEIIMAAKSYTQDNRNSLPKRVGMTTEVTLDTLQKKKYIGDVVDRHKNSCYSQTTVVKIFRYDKNNYSYSVYLDCKEYKSNKKTNDGQIGDIAIEFKTGENLLPDDATKLDVGYNTINSKVTIPTDNGKIVSYQYIVSQAGKELKNSGEINGRLKSKIEFTIPLEAYLPGKIKITVIAVDYYGNTKTVSKEKDIKNKNAPDCYDKVENDTWTNKPVEVSAKCKDKFGKGCQKDVYTQLFAAKNTDTETGIIDIVDKDGNLGKCELKVLRDVTPPETPTITNPKEGKWANKSYSLKVESSDATSGIAYFAYCYPYTNDIKGKYCEIESHWHKYANSSRPAKDSTPFTTTPFSKERNEEVEIRACDYAGNCSAGARTTISIDTTPPTCKVTKSDSRSYNGWYLENVSLTLTYENPKGTASTAVASKIVTYGLAANNKESTNGKTTGVQTADTKNVIWYGYVKDAAGNDVSCNSGAFKKDATPPTTPKIK